VGDSMIVINTDNAKEGEKGVKVLTKVKEIKKS
jgi:hypothetical protein